MILLDSNLIVYSLYNESPKQFMARKFINDNMAKLCVSHQNILESLRVLTHLKFESPMSSKNANIAVWEVVNALNLIGPNVESLFLVRELINKHNLTGNKIFDAYLVATALSNGISVVATDNVKDFKIFDEISVINPFLVK